MTAVQAPAIKAEMDDWVAKGGGNSGICADANHTYGFHLAANLVSADDYSRWRDPNGSDGPYVDWDYCCAGDFSHKNDPELRKMHADVLNDLMDGKYPMVCEFIGKPWADKPVYYWARWNGIDVLQKYTGSGHDHWSHISWYRSRVDERANLWTGDDMAVSSDDARKIFNTDNSIKSSPFYWRTDSPGHTPPGDNEGYEAETALIEAATRANLAYETALAVKEQTTTIDADLQFVQAKLDQVLAILQAGVPVPGEVNLTEASKLAVAEATADEIAQRGQE